MDLRPGGASEVTMYGPDGESFPNPGMYLEVADCGGPFQPFIIPFEWVASDWEGWAYPACSTTTLIPPGDSLWPIPLKI